MNEAWAGWLVAAALAAALWWIWHRAQQRHDADARALEALRAQQRQAEAELKELRAASTRQIRAAQEEAQHAPAKLARALLPVDDALQRALAARGAAEDWREGAALIVRQLEAVLEPFAIRPLDAAPGQPFDPHLHECIAEAPGAEHGALHLTEVTRRGWREHDRLLRPAEVVVTRVLAPSSPPPRPEEPTEVELPAPDAGEETAWVRLRHDADPEVTEELTDEVHVGQRR
jgi:molecular chaperone GrpE